MNMLKCISVINEADGRTYVDKEGDEIVSSSWFLLLSHNASGFDRWVVLNSLDEVIGDINIIKTARGLKSFQSVVMLKQSIRLKYLNTLNSHALNLI